MDNGAPAQPAETTSSLGIAARRVRRPVVLGLVIAGLLFGAYLFAFVAPTVQTFGYDAFAYWNVDLQGPYGVDYGALSSFNYAPPIALIADIFGYVDWPTFIWLWTLLLVGTVVWIAGSPGWVLAAFSFPFVAVELYHGNINILLAAAIVLGFRHPWTWTFVLLTKPTSGVGLLWFAARGEWRSLGTALGVTTVICVVSFLLMPSLWFDYLGAMTDNLSHLPHTVAVPLSLWVRLPAAAVLVIWGARTNRRWTVVVSSTLALPVLWPGSGAMLIGLIPELRRRHRDSPMTTDAAPD